MQSTRTSAAALMLAVLTWQCASAQAPAAEPVYTIKNDTPRTGSNLKGNGVTAPLPVNKRYEQLSPEQKQAFKANYDAMPDDDEPPFPADGLEPLLRAVHAANEKVGNIGLLEVHVTVGGDGQPVQARILNSPTNAMGRFTAQALMLTKFKPARCSGAPCRMDFPLRIDFRRER